MAQKEYSVTISVTVGIRAQNQEQAEERSELIVDGLTLKLPRPSRWADEPEFAVEEVTEE